MGGVIYQYFYMLCFETTLYTYIPCQSVHKSASSFNSLHGVLLLDINI